MGGALSVKLMGSALITFSAMLTAAGCVEPYRSSIALMLELRSALGVMKNELNDRLSTVPELLRLCSAEAQGSVKQFFDGVLNSLSALGDVELSAIWRESAEKYLSGLPQNVMRELLCLGQTIGTSDAEAQMSKLDCVMSTIDRSVKERERELPEKKRLAGAIALSIGGFMIVILI